MSADFFSFYIFYFIFPLQDVPPFRLSISFLVFCLLLECFIQPNILFHHGYLLYFYVFHRCPPTWMRSTSCVCVRAPPVANTPVHGVFDEKDNQNHVLRKKPLPTARSYSQCGGGEGRFASERYKHRIFIRSFDYEFLISRCLVISIYWLIRPFFFFLGDLYNKYIYFPV